MDVFLFELTLSLSNQLLIILKTNAVYDYVIHAMDIVIEIFSNFEDQFLPINHFFPKSAVRCLFTL